MGNKAKGRKILIFFMLIQCMCISYYISKTGIKQGTEISVVGNITGLKVEATVLNDSVSLRGRSTPINMPTNSSPLLVIFTTFHNSAERFHVQMNTLMNWAQYAPQVKPVLFLVDPVDKSEYTQRANELGWDVFQVPATNKHGLPFLKPMYTKIMDTYNATFYAYSNGDIIYDIGLVKTLEFLKSNLSGSAGPGTLIVGRRINYFNNHSLNILYKSEDVHELGITREPHVAAAVDYFIIKGHGYPFDKLPNFVIGRVAYDNFMVSLALESGLIGVDITATAVALHQNIHRKIGDGRWAERSLFNMEMIKRSTYKSNYNIGKIDMVPYFTYFNNQSEKIDKGIREKQLSHQRSLSGRRRGSRGHHVRA